ncbi:hypothetical protein Cgig2_006478 [Carnegiea gigantea]|uniref:Uncharacterized protein n=1 Tax=Carnegiea gigantea TaxID=171969 RepID=A0A9Q1JVD0_9CARY|nr:hypothetical protein Cgig2_006478 [Carnegiea gigantea]
MMYSPSSCIKQISVLINVSLNMLLNISSNINMTTSNLNRKQKRPCMSLFLKGTLVMGGCDWLTIGVQRNMRLWLKLVEMHELRKCIVIQLVETHGREPTHLEFFKETHGKDGGGFVANTATESFLCKSSRAILGSSPSKTQVEIENEVFDELMYEEENPKRPIGFGCNVDRSDVFGVNSILRKRGYIFADNNMELKRVKEELASQKAMFLLMLKAVRNRKITDEFLDATEAALRMASDQVDEVVLLKTFDDCISRLGN